MRTPPQPALLPLEPPYAPPVASTYDAPAPVATERSVAGASRAARFLRGRPDDPVWVRPALLTLLVGLGLVEFSMTPGAIPVAKRVLGDVRRDEMHALARRVLRMATIAEIERELHAVLGRLTV